MTPDVIARLVAELKTAFPGSVSAVDGGQTMVKIPKGPLPAGCKPESVQCLVVLGQEAAQPELYIRPVPTRADGGTPKNTSPITVGGESWYTFSYSMSWHVNQHTAEQFVRGRLQRFAKNE